MGGTTAKGAIVRGGEPLKRYEIEVARIHEFKQGSGLPVEDPGHRHDRDRRRRRQHRRARRARRASRVGPRSAGADPGPACYGRGGQSADAHRREPAARLSRLRLTSSAARCGSMRTPPRAVVQTRIAAPLGIDADARRLGHPRGHQRGRRARLPRARLRARLRLPLLRAWSPSADRARCMPRASRASCASRASSSRSAPASCRRSACWRARSASRRPARSASPTTTSPRSASSHSSTSSRSRLRASCARPELRPGTSRVVHRLDMRYVGQGYEVEVAGARRNAVRRKPTGRCRLALPRATRKIFSISYLERAARDHELEGRGDRSGAGEGRRHASGRRDAAHQGDEGDAPRLLPRCRRLCRGRRLRPLHAARQARRSTDRRWSRNRNRHVCSVLATSRRIDGKGNLIAEVPVALAARTGTGG